MVCLVLVPVQLRAELLPPGRDVAHPVDQSELSIASVSTNHGAPVLQLLVDVALAGHGAAVPVRDQPQRLAPDPLRLLPRLRGHGREERSPSVTAMYKYKYIDIHNNWRVPSIMLLVENTNMRFCNL